MAEAVQDIQPIGVILLPIDVLQTAVEMFPRSVSMAPYEPNGCAICHKCCCHHKNATLNIFGENDGTINIVVTNGSCLEEGSVPGISESRTTDLVMTRNGLPMSPFSEERSMPETPETFGRSSRRNRNVGGWEETFESGTLAGKPLLCKFCRSNGETYEFYTQHALKIKGVVTCPILRSYRCPLCGATGNMAHTPKYCPTHSKQSLRSMFGHNAFGKSKLLKY